MNDTDFNIGDKVSIPWIRIPLKAVVLYLAFELNLNSAELIVFVTALILGEIPEFLGQRIVNKSPQHKKSAAIVLGGINIAVTFFLLWFARLLDTDIYLLIYLVLAAVTIPTGVIGGISMGLTSAILYLILSAGLIDPFSSMFRAITFVLLGVLLGVVAESNLTNGKRYREILDTISHRKEANDLKENFLTIAYHSLRTPLTAIKGYSSALNDPKITDDDRRTYFHYMQDSIKNMNAIIENVFKVVRVDEDYELEIERYDIVLLIKEVIQSLEAQVKHKNVIIQFNSYKETSGIIIPIDVKRLRSAFTNIIDNAIRYSNERGVVKVSVNDNLNLVNISVTNTGEGIPPSELNFIFEKFHRVNVLTPDSEGLGIGLYVAKKIIEKHNGSLEINSQPKKFTTVKIVLPKVTGQTFFSGIS